MIDIRGGRARSIREQSEVEAALREELKGLTPEELAVLDLLLKEQGKAPLPGVDPGLSVLRALERTEWKVPPVDMRTFIYDPYYLGESCGELYPSHYADLSELFDRGGYHEALWTGAIGCLRGDTPVHDPVTGITASVEARYQEGRPFHVWSRSDAGPVIAEAWAPLRYPEAPMFRVTLDTGESCVVTPEHRFWDGFRWVTASEVRERLRGSELVLLPSSSDIVPSTRARGALRSTRRVPGSPGGCRPGLRSDGGRPPSDREDARGWSPSRGDALGRTRGYPRSDGQGEGGAHSRTCRASAPPSTTSSSLLSGPDAEALLLALEGRRPPGSDSIRRVRRLLAACALLGTALGLGPDAHPSIAPQGCRASRASIGPSWGELYPDGSEWTRTAARVVSVETEAPEPYFDFHVPIHNNYAAAGLWHHNTGKSFSASVGVCRVLYEISCMRDPHGAFHIARHSPIHLVCLSVTEDLAIKVAFDYIIEKIQLSPYFRENFPYRPGKKEFLFPNKVSLAARATTDTSALGLNVISVFLDESDFIKKPGKAKLAAGEKDTAERIYAKLKRRVKSRFQRNGRLPGMLFIVSSKRRTDDFSARHIEKSRHDPTVFVSDKSLWDVKPESYSKERFHVFVGNESLPSKILEPAEVETYRAVAEGKDTCVVLEVPEDFRPDFERELEEAIRDIAGVATVSIAPFIQRRERIQAAADYGDANGLLHPFSTVEYVPGSGAEFLWGILAETYSHPLSEGGYETKWRPRLNPWAARHVHIDPSLTGDSTGLAIGHVAGYKEVLRRDSNHRIYAEKAPVIVIDLILRIVPPLGDEIILGDVRALVYQWAEHGFRLAKITMDSFQSADGLQQMAQKGYSAEVYSVDRTPTAYEMLKTALYEGRLIYYGYPKLLEELRKLEKNHVTHKVDHPPMGSKDCADAVAALVATLSGVIADVATDPLPMLRGLSYSPELVSPSAASTPAQAAQVAHAPVSDRVASAPLGMVAPEPHDSNPYGAEYEP